MRNRIPNVLAILMALLLSMPGYFGNTALAASPLSVVVTDSPDPVQSGQILMYTWTVTNNGGAKVTEVIGTTQVDLAGIGVPPQLVITSDVGTCAQANSTVTCNAGTLQGGQVWTVTIRGLVNAPSGTVLNNTVTVTSSKSAQTFSDSGSATTLVLGTAPGGDKPDLSVQKVGPASVVISDFFTYQLTVNNTGNANASNVKVIDNLPAGVTFVSATGTSLFSCSYAAPAVTCDGGNVNAGANATINIDVQAPPVTGTIANNAVVDPFDAIVESGEFNNTSATIFTTVTPAPPPPPYTITKVQTSPIYAGYPNVVVPGDTVVYTITATNISGGRSDYNKILDATQGLDAASLSVSATLTGGGAFLECTIAAPNAQCTWTRWPAGASITMIVTGRVVQPSGTTIRDTATITGNVRNTGYSATTNLVSTIKPAVDLTITKADSPDPICASSWPPAAPGVLCSSGLTYTYVVGNSGIFEVKGVLIRDPLPAGLIFDGYSAPAFAGGCSVDAQNVLTCTNGTIPPESTVTVTVTMVAPPTVGTITNTVTVDPTNAIFESDETNNVATQTTTIGTGIDLTILKTDVAPGFEPIATSGTQTYTITVDNIGPQDATNIRVRDALPAATTFLSATADNGFTCSYNAGIVECINGHILGTKSESYDPPGPAVLDDATIIIKIFAQPTVGTMHNEVRVDPLGEIAEINETNNFDFEDTVVGTGDTPIGAFNQLTITKTQTAPLPTGVAVARNAVVTYDLLVENKGTDPAVGIAVRDYLPAGAVYIEAKDTMIGPDAFNCIQVSNIVTCTGGTLSGTNPAVAILGVPTSRHITVKMFAPDTPGNYINQAIVDPDNAIPEGNEFDNISSIPLTVANAGIAPFNELTISKTAAPTPIVKINAELTYTLLVTNSGSDPAFDVVVTDVLPAGVTFLTAYDISATNGMFTCSAASGIVTCSGGTLDGVPNPPTFPAGPLGAAYPEARTILVKVLAPNQHNLSLLNTARVDPGNQIPEGDETNNASSATVTAKSFIDLSITKQGQDSAPQSSTFEYTIVAKNNKVGPSGAGDDAFNVKIHDALPVGLIVLDVYTTDPGSNNFNCQVFENPVNFIDCIGTLVADQEVTIKVKVFVTAADSAKLDNEACIDPANLIIESDEITNNCSTTTTTVGAPDISVSKSALHNPVSPGQDQVYTIIATNTGSVAATAVTITDTLQSSQTFVAAIGTNGFTCTNAAGTVTCTHPGAGDALAAGASTTITLTATVPASATGPITNCATSSSTPSDPNATNDTGCITTSVSGGAGVDLQLTNVQDLPDPASQGYPMTYTYQILNAGTATAGLEAGKPVVIRSTISNGLNTIAAVASEGFSCDAAIGDSPVTFNCTSPATGLEAGHTVTVTVTALVDADAPANITNEVKVDPDSLITESNETNNDFTAATSTVAATCPASPPGTPCIDLVVSTILATPEPVSGTGGTLSYTVTVGNAGNVSTTTGTDGTCAGFFIPPGCAVVIITLPGEVAYDSGSIAASAGFTCTEFFVTVLYCAGELNASQGVIISLTGTVTASSGTAFVTTVDAALNGTIADFNTANDSSSVTNHAE